MKQPPAALVPLLAVAAELRAGGLSWEQVGAEVHRTAEAVRKWPREYPQAWAAAFRTAADRLDGDAGAEAVLTLRGLLRSADERVRLDAARVIVGAKVEARKLELRAAELLAADPNADPLFAEALRLTRLVKDMTDDQVLAEFADARPLALPAGRPVGDGPPAG